MKSWRRVQMRGPGVRFAILLSGVLVYCGFGLAKAAEQAWHGQAVLIAGDAQQMAKIPGNAAEGVSYRRVGAILEGDEPGYVVVDGRARQEGKVVGYHGEVTITYRSGGKIMGTLSGSADPEAGWDRGRLEITGGEGKFAGATGSGTYDGMILAPLDQGGTAVYQLEGIIRVGD